MLKRKTKQKSDDNDHWHKLSPPKKQKNKKKSIKNQTKNEYATEMKINLKLPSGEKKCKQNE